LHDALAVALRFRAGIDARNGEAFDLAAERLRDVRGRVRGRQVHRQPRALASSTAIAAAIVVLPTPPLPITMIMP
jgi:hypothetical protein